MGRHYIRRNHEQRGSHLHLAQNQNIETLTSLPAYPKDKIMEFSENKSIYLQIYDAICEKILIGDLSPDSRIQSVREYGAEIGVNPNTVMRSYERLTSDGIIYNRRGIGYFISNDAKESVLQNLRKDFMENELPPIKRKMELLGIKPEDIL